MLTPGPEQIRGQAACAESESVELNAVKPGECDKSELAIQFANKNINTVNQLHVGKSPGQSSDSLTSSACGRRSVQD